MGFQEGWNLGYWLRAGTFRWSPLTPRLERHHQAALWCRIPVAECSPVPSVVTRSRASSPGSLLGGTFVQEMHSMVTWLR